MNKKSRKRILFFIESFSGGGAERVLLTILRNLDMEKFDVTVLVMSDSGVYSKDFHSLGINVVPVLSSNSSMLNRVKYKLLYNILSPKVAARWLLKGIEADTYVAFVEGYCTKILSCLRSDKRKIAWVHIDLKNFPWTIEEGIYQNIKEEKDAYEMFDMSIGVSNEVSDVLKTQYGLKYVRTIYNPIDENRIIKMSREQSDIQIDKSTFNIISVGRLSHQKGYDKLINLMPRILARNPLVKLYIVGEGEERRNLENQIKVRTIYNPIDENRIIKMSREQSDIQIDKSTFNIISVGRLSHQKGYDKLINLMPRILARNPLVKLYIVGEGEERRNLENQIKEQHLTDNVILTGFVKNPYSLMKKMDLFVCSSVAEGFSLVIAEALTVGLPVVSMECAGPNELLGQGKYGLLCSTYDELTNTIVNISQDKKFLQELCEKSRIRASDFNTTNIISTIENIL